MTETWLWLEPELATLTKARFSDPAWMYERKFDGERCLTYRTGGKVALMTRNQIDVSATYPELRGALAGQSSADYVVDASPVTTASPAPIFRASCRVPGDQRLGFMITWRLLVRPAESFRSTESSPRGSTEEPP